MSEEKRVRDVEETVDSEEVIAPRRDAGWVLRDKSAGLHVQDDRANEYEREVREVPGNPLPKRPEVPPEDKTRNEFADHPTPVDPVARLGIECEP